MERSSFFNAILNQDGNPDRHYLAEDYARYFSSFIGNGVYPNPSSNLQVIANDDMTVTVKPGKGWINGYFYENTDNLILDIDVADGALNRIDTVVLQYRGLIDDGRKIVIKIKKGAFASNPRATNLRGDSDIYELKLANISINHGATQITQAQITDTRLDNSVCGIVTGVIKQADTTALYKQIQDDLLQFKNGSEAGFNSWSEEQKAAFNTWLDGIKSVLDGDTAGNLFNLINGVKTDLNTHTSDTTAHISTYTHTKNGTIHKLQGMGNNIEFKATADIADGDTWTVNGKNVIAVLSNGEPLTEDTFKNGNWVTGIRLDGNKLNFRSGSGGGVAFSQGWEDSRIAEAFENIAKYNPIVMQKYGSWDTQINSIPNPKVLPPNPVRVVTFSPDNNYLAVGHFSSPYITIYKRNGDTFTKLSNPKVLPPDTIEAATFSPDGNYLVVGNDDSPYIIIYRRNGDTFTKIPNPKVLPPNFVRAVTFSPDGNYLVVGHGNSPYITIYKRNGDTFTKLSNPKVLPSDTLRAATFSPDEKYLAVANRKETIIYKRNINIFTKITVPDLERNFNSITFSPDNNYFVGASQISGIRIYKHKKDTFTRLPDPDKQTRSTTYSVAFSPDSNYLVAGWCYSPQIYIYKRNGDVFTKIADPTLLPKGSVKSLAFSLDGNYLAAGNDESPYVTIYRTQSKKIIRNATKFGNCPLYWLPQGNFGLSLESKNKGQQCKVNLFPKLNNIIEE